MSATEVKPLSFKDQDFYIGLDVHKRQWTVSVVTMNMLVKKHVSIEPSPAALVSYMHRRFPEGHYYAAYEAGFCGFWIARQLKALGLNCQVIHPADVPTSQKERLGKNDRIDSTKIARSLASNRLTAIYIPERLAEEYRYLNRYRKRLVQDQTRIQNRIKSTLAYFGVAIPQVYGNRRWSGAFIQWLSTIEFETEFAKVAFEELLEQLQQMRSRITRVLKKIRELAKEVSPFNTIVPLLQSVPGIGFIGAMILASELIDMKRFKTLEALAAFVGLIPIVQSSDEKKKKLGITQRRNTHLRTLLIEAAWIAVKVDPALLMKFKELCCRMNQNKAIVRIAKILLNRIRRVWNTQTPYVKAIVA